MEEMSIGRPLKKTNPTEASIEIYPGNKVLVWREKIVENLIGEKMVNFNLIDIEAQKKLFNDLYTEVRPDRTFNEKKVNHYCDT